MLRVNCCPHWGWSPASATSAKIDVMAIVQHEKCFSNVTKILPEWRPARAEGGFNRSVFRLCVVCFVGKVGVFFPAFHDNSPRPRIPAKARGLTEPTAKA
jgi:hypothetical protein